MYVCMTACLAHIHMRRYIIYICNTYIHTYAHTYIHTYLYMDNNADTESKSDFRLTAAVNNHQAELASEGSGLSCLRVLRVLGFVVFL